MKNGNLVLLVGLCLLLAACGRASDREWSPKFYADAPPEALRDWGIFDTSETRLVLADGVKPYDLNTPLFTDYAQKLRTVWTPEGTSISLTENGAFEYPVGTVISKTFYYPRARQEAAVKKSVSVEGEFDPALDDLASIRLIETRLLVHKASGWEPVSYIWNDAQTDARLTRIGAIEPLTMVDEAGVKTDFAYVVPNINQCAGCHAPNHTTKAIAPLGFNPRHLNKSFEHDGDTVNQISHLTRAADVAGLPANANWTDTTVSLDARARAYLDINCSHCHNPVGPADTSGLHLGGDAPVGAELGLCKYPIAAGKGTGGRQFDIVPGAPDASILLHRMEITDPGSLMPELGRSLVHQEGVSLIRAWIESLPGSCNA